MKRNLRVWVACGFCSLLTVMASAADWTFEGTQIGCLPKGWSIVRTDGEVGEAYRKWEVLADATAPRGPKVLVHTSYDCEGPLFNTSVADKPMLMDVDLSVTFKVASGENEQGGGLVWRWQDSKNYYLAGIRPLEHKFHLSKVIDGKQYPLATVHLDAAADTWHVIRVAHYGDKIQCSFNHKKLIDATDGVIGKSGQVGLWGMADAVTSFDVVSIVELEANRPAATVQENRDNQT